MIMMMWTRNDHGDLTAFPINPQRARQFRQRKEKFIQAMRRVMQRVYCHEMAALYLYQVLANRELDVNRRKILLVLARSQQRRLAHRGEVIQRLNASVPAACLSFGLRFWLNFLARLGVRVATTYIRYLNHLDLRDQMKLIEMLQRLEVT